MDQHLLSWMTFLPLIGGLVILCLPKEKLGAIRWTALGFSVLSLLCSLQMLRDYNADSVELQFVEKAAWIPSLNIQYFLGADGLSVAMLFLTTALSVLSILASFNIEVRVKEYMFFFLLLETGMLGVFVALDFFLFYVFWEITLVPMYFLIGIWGGPRKEYAAIKFFLYTLAGSVIMLLGILALYLYSTPHTFDMIEIAKTVSFPSGSMKYWVFLALFIGFAVKVPVFPFHTWLPDAHVEAPTAVSVILAGVLLKMGTYGLLRISYSILPAVAMELSWWLAILAMINIVYGAFVAMAQTDMKKMVAYSSVNHMGYVLLGMAAMNEIGLQGAVLQMFNHGIITGCLFLLVGVIYERAHTRDINVFGGLAAKVPFYFSMTTIACMASLGLPTLAGFVSEFMCFLGAFQNPELRVITGISLLGVVLTVGFLLTLILKVFLGPLGEKFKEMTDMTFREKVTVIPLIIMTIVVGVYPQIVLDTMRVKVQALVQLLKSTSGLS